MPDTSPSARLDTDLDTALDTDLDTGLARPAVAVACLAVVVGVLAAGRWIQRAEATASTFVAQTAGVSDAHRIGTAVVFQQDGRAIGYAITLGCTVAFLLLPFVLGTGVVLTVQRISVARALAALGTAVVVVAAVNQVRLLAILTGIRLWGLERGYSATHVLLGTAISTVGVVTAALLFLTVITRASRPRRQQLATGGARRG